MDRVHRGLCPRVSAFAGFRANPDTPGVTYKMVKDYKVIMKIKKFRKKMGPFLGAQAKRAGGRGPPARVVHFLQIVRHTRAHTARARSARFRRRGQAFYGNFIRGLFCLFAAGAKANVGALLSEQVKALGRITPTVRACLFGYIEASIFANPLRLRGAEHALGRALRLDVPRGANRAPDVHRRRFFRGIETMREWAPFPLNGSSTVNGLYLLR
jgi:hypothetical protein